MPAGTACQLSRYDIVTESEYSRTRHTAAAVQLIAENGGSRKSVGSDSGARGAGGRTTIAAAIQPQADKAHRAEADHVYQKLHHEGLAFNSELKAPEQRENAANREDLE
jgi:hypothetical protein